MYIGLPSLGLRSSSAGFSPASLFAAGEQGGWYDPSDMSTMWQDSAGTTPAVLEGPVGKLNDKSGRGNHLIQATAASRPTLSARYNKLIKSEQFDDAGWAKTFASVTANSLGTADTVTEDASAGQQHAVTQIPAASASTAYEIAFKIKRNVGSRDFYIQINNNTTGTGGAAYATFTLTGAGTATVQADLVAGFTAKSATITLDSDGGYICRFFLTTVATTATLLIIGALYDGVTRVYNGDGTSSLYFYYASFRTSADAALSIPAYQRVDTATSYDTIGFPMYLNFDGVDDNMASAVIAATFAQPTTLAVACQAGAISGLPDLVDVSDGVNRNQLGIRTSFFEMYAGNTVNIIAADTSTKVLDVLFNGASSDAYYNRTLVSGLNANTNSPVSPTITVGAVKGGTGEIWNGRISGIIYIRRALTTTERLTSDRYLGSKCGVLL